MIGKGNIGQESADSVGFKSRRASVCGDEGGSEIEDDIHSGIGGGDGLHQRDGDVCWEDERAGMQLAVAGFDNFCGEAKDVRIWFGSPVMVKLLEEMQEEVKMAPPRCVGGGPRPRPIEGCVAIVPSTALAAVAGPALGIP